MKLTYASDGGLWHAMHGNSDSVLLGGASTYCGRVLKALVVTTRQPKDDEYCAKCARNAVEVDLG